MSALPHVIVLAAGASERFGSPKQLVSVAGVPMLQLVLARAQALAGSAVTVVLGAHAAQIAPAVGHLSATVVINRGWQEGVAASIRAGVERLPGDCPGTLLWLADQIAVTDADLRRLVDKWGADPLAIAAAQYAGTYGVPAVFPSSCFPALLELRGERGAQMLLRAPPGRLCGVPMPSAAFDIDTPQDLQALTGPLKRA